MSLLCSRSSSVHTTIFNYFLLCPFITSLSLPSTINPSAFLLLTALMLHFSLQFSTCFPSFRPFFYSFFKPLNGTSALILESHQYAKFLTPQKQAWPVQQSNLKQMHNHSRSLFFNFLVKSFTDDLLARVPFVQQKI